MTGEQQTGVEVKLGLLHEDVNDMKKVLKDLTVAINRLAVIEERQSNAAAALERAFTALEKVEERIAKAEEKIANLQAKSFDASRTVAWVDKAVWAAAGLAIAIVIYKSGVLR